MINNDLNPNSPTFDRKKFKEAIAWVESAGGKYLSNKNSSAAGRYHFLYRYIKDIPELKGVSKLEFINSKELQEKVMDMALDGNLKGFPNYIDYSSNLKSKYKSDLSHEDIAALTHFLGMGGVRNYLKDSSEFKVPGNNATVDQYLKRFRSIYGKKPEVKDKIEKPQPIIQEQPKDNIPTIQVPKQRIPEQPRIPQAQPRKFIETEYQEQPNQNTDVLGFLQNPKAYGGNVEEGNVKDLVRFDEGGTHEQNPYGGLPIGTDNNGNVNTVEEGETKFKFDDGDYVFSDRIGLYPTK